MTDNAFWKVLITCLLLQAGDTPVENSQASTAEDRPLLFFLTVCSVIATQSISHSLGVY